MRLNSKKSIVWGKKNKTCALHTAQEFHPYVFQIFAQLIDLRPPPLPPLYLQLFKPLLAPLFWERPGNVPALTRLLRAYLAKASAEILQQGLLEVRLLFWSSGPLPSCGSNEAMKLCAGQVPANDKQNVRQLLGPFRLQDEGLLAMSEAGKKNAGAHLPFCQSRSCSSSRFHHWSSGPGGAQHVYPCCRWVRRACWACSRSWWPARRTTTRGSASWRPSCAAPPWTPSNPTCPRWATLHSCTPRQPAGLSYFGPTTVCLHGTVCIGCCPCCEVLPQGWQLHSSYQARTCCARFLAADCDAALTTMRHRAQLSMPSSMWRGAV